MLADATFDDAIERLVFLAKIDEALAPLAAERQNRWADDGLENYPYTAPERREGVQLIASQRLGDTDAVSGDGRRWSTWIPSSGGL